MKKAKYKLVSNKLGSIYRGLSADLIFYYAIDSIFFSQVRGMSFSLIAFLTTFMGICYIALQYPTIKIVRILGNSLSTKIGCFLFLISSLMITFCSSIVMIFIGHFFYIFGACFLDLSSSQILKNNLAYENRPDDYSKIIGSGRALYGFITAVASFVSGYLFTINNYLPMYLCIMFSVITFVISFFYNDATETYSGLIFKGGTTERADTKLNIKELFTNKFAIVILLFSLFMMCPLHIGFIYSKMLFQDIMVATVTITIIIGICRIFRGIASYIYPYIYRKIKHHSLYLFTILFALSFGLISISALFDNNKVCCILLIAGVIILYSVRDPFQLYRENLIMNLDGLNYRRELISFSNTTQKIGDIAIGFLCTSLLIAHSVAFVYFCILCICIIPLIFLTIYTFIKLKQQKN